MNYSLSRRLYPKDLYRFTIKRPINIRSACNTTFPDIEHKLEKGNSYSNKDDINRNINFWLGKYAKSIFTTPYKQIICRLC